MWPHLWIRFAGLGATDVEYLGRSAVYSSVATPCASQLSHFRCVYHWRQNEWWLFCQCSTDLLWRWKPQQSSSSPASTCVGWEKVLWYRHSTPPVMVFCIWDLFKGFCIALPCSISKHLSSLVTSQPSTALINCSFRNYENSEINWTGEMSPLFWHGSSWLQG